MTFFSELKRRNVFKVGVAYAALAWVLIQVISTVLPAFGAPRWMEPTLMFVVIIGFPIALFLSWAYELTPQGIRQTATPGEMEARAIVRDSRRIPFLTLLISFGFLYVCIDQYYLEEVNAANRQTRETSNESSLDKDERLPNSIAVLPFEYSSQDSDISSFAAGINDEVLNHLIKLNYLNVLGPASLQPGMDDTMPVTELGKALRVEIIIYGSVRFADDRVAINARLVNARTGVYLWSERYNREYKDIFNIQQDVASNIVGALETEINQNFDPIHGLAQKVKGFAYLNSGRVEEAELSIDRAVNAN